MNWNPCAWLLVAGLGLSAGHIAQVRAAEKTEEEKKKDEQKKEEEKFRQNALNAVQTDGSVKGDGVQSYSGQFEFQADPNESKYPKSAGVLTSEAGGVYKVMVADQGLLDSLKGQDKKKVHLMGKEVSKNEKESVLVVNEVIPMPGPVEIRRKRGGLP